MKKYITILLILLLTICGCSSKKIETKRIAVLQGKTDNLVLLLDNENKVLDKKEIKNVNYFYYDDGKFYSSLDGVNFSGFDIYSLEDLDDIVNVSGRLIKYVEKDRYIKYESGKIYFVEGNSQKESEGYLCHYISDSNYFYMLDYSNYLYIYNLTDFSLESKSRVSNSNYLNFAKIDNEVYLVNDYGYQVISLDKDNYTYVYPNDFNSIDNNYADLLFVVENKEDVVYRVTFKDNKMELIDELDEIYYRNIDFSQEFKDYYQEGYEVVYYLETY